MYSNSYHQHEFYEGCIISDRVVYDEEGYIKAHLINEVPVSWLEFIDSLERLVVTPADHNIIYIERYRQARGENRFLPPLSANDVRLLTILDNEESELIQG